MSFAIAAPEVLGAAATDLANIGSTLTRFRESLDAGPQTRYRQPNS
jgi:hypothetical protein